MQLVVGRIGKAHGIRGDVAVEPRTDDVEARFAVGIAVDTEPETVGPLTVDGVRWHSGRLLVRFRGVDDRSAAERLRGVLLVADSATSPQLDDPDEYWDHDLEGLAVVLTDGSPVGTVDAVLHPPGGDLLAVRRPDGGEVLVPFVRAIVPDIDMVGRRLTVDPPDGLLDL